MQEEADKQSEDRHTQTQRDLGTLEDGGPRGMGLLWIGM